MSNWFRSLGTFAVNILQANPPTKVLEVNTDSYSGRVIHCREDGLLLYCPSPTVPESRYEIVLQRPVTETLAKAYSLCRCETIESAELWFHRLVGKVPTLFSVSKDTNLAWLQRVCDLITEHPSWNIAHLAVKLQLTDCLSDTRVINAFHCEDPHDGVSPLHVAVENENIKIIKHLLINGAPVDHFDHNCNSTLHYAACTNKKVVMVVIEQSKNTINSKNAQGQTPLHVACAKDKRECVIALLEAGADVNISVESNGGGEPGLVGDSLQLFPGKLSQEDMKFGGTPLHWACSQEVVEALVEKRCNLNAVNFHRRTALHMMVMRGRFDCVVGLLSLGADTTLCDMDGNTALRMAVQKLDALSVKALIVFNADINELNSSQHSLRHGLMCGQSPADDVLYVLHSVGVKRCAPGIRGCTSACSPVESYNGIAPPLVPTSMSRDTLNLILEEVVPQKNKTCYGRLLCLDGGGIRGLILVVALMELEKAVGKPIIHCFDWIAGTSTGGILALALAWGKSLHECLNLYFSLKNKVFVGMRPYSSETLENILKEAFGEETTMTDIVNPKMMITATLVDRNPVDLHLFRNYPSPSDILEVPHSGPWREPKPPPLQRLWEAARATGAAPSYFNAAGCYVDGGLISNNPTLDAMTEIHEYNSSLRAVGRHDDATQLSIVVSLGTGSVPRTDNEAAMGLLQRWGNIFDFLNLNFLNLGSMKGIGQIVTMLVDQATQADGRVVDRARAWCSSLGVPYYRFCPLLSKDVALNETQNDKLINMMWETRAYMHTKMADLTELVAILKQPLTLAQPRLRD